MVDMSSAGPAPSADKSYVDAPYVSVRWIGSGQWVLVEWKAWANSSEYKAAHEAVIVALRENRGSRNLIDAREARVVSDDDQKWLIENWIPRAVAAGRIWTAVVMPTRALARTISENIDKRPSPNPAEVEYFQSVEAAAAWLSTVS
jgi:FAD/FMN-containing dehydrogenase